MFLVLVVKCLLVVFCAQHITAEYSNFRIDHEKDDINELANILKYYVTIFHRDNRRFIMIKYLASNSEELQRQTDLVQMLISNTRDLYVTYIFLDLEMFSDQPNPYRGLNIVLFDNPNTFE